MSDFDTPWSTENCDDSDVFILTLQIGSSAACEDGSKWLDTPAVSIVDSLTNLHPRTSPGKHLDMVVIPATTLHSDLAALLGSPCHKRLRFDSSGGLSQSESLALIYIAATVKIGLLESSRLNANPVALDYLRRAMTTILLHGARHNYTDLILSIPSDVTPARIKRAIEFMYANAGVSLKLAQIAESAALSVRGLQTGFMRHKGMTPMSFLRKVRLERVREDLLNPGVTENCEQIASRWGFANFHRFAKNYADAFGEPPRVTHRKARVVSSG